MKCRWQTSAAAALLVFASLAVADEPEPTPRERELERQIQALLKRVERLEQQLAIEEPAPPTQPPPPEPVTPAPEPVLPEPGGNLEDRVAKIEDRLFKHPTPLDLYWKEGIRFDSPNGAFKFKLGGRIMLDGAIMDADDRIERGAFGFRRRGTGDLEDAVEFRRARLYLEGQIYDTAFFKSEYDFAGGDADFKDVFVGLKKLPLVGQVKAGQFKEPFSLEELTSSRYITFMERSLGNESLVPSRNTGIMFYDSAFDQRMTWQAGMFIPTDSFGDGEFNDGFNYTGRLTGLAWYEDDGARLLHLGAAASHQNYEGDRDRGQHMVRFRERPEAHLAPRFVDTGTFFAESANLLGGELAWVHGPFSLQSEFIWASVDGVGSVFGRTPNPDFKSFYVMGSYFLTGEHRVYKRSGGVFDRVKPRRNFREDGGWGAWEIAGRYSLVDLDDDGIRGGELNDFTLGLNWYLNPNMRMMFNYIYADNEDTGDANLFMLRAQVDF